MSKSKKVDKILFINVCLIILFGLIIFFSASLCLGYAKTRRASRQVVNHGHITVDGKRLDIPSYEVKPGQVISLRERSKNLQIVKDALEAIVGRPAFVSFDDNKLEGSLVRLPERDELDANIDEALIVEYYNQLG